MSDDILQSLGTILNIFNIAGEIYRGRHNFFSFSKGSKSLRWMNILNSKFARRYEIYGMLDQIPQIKIGNQYRLRSDFMERAQEIKKQLQEQNIPNEIHAKVISKLRDVPNSQIIKVAPLFYDSVKTLRENGKKPALLSTCAVLICEEQRRLVIQRRSANVATHPNHFHTIGGAFRPYRGNPLDEDKDIVDSIIREVHEESGIRLGEHNLPMIMLAQEKDTGFIQIVFLGFNVVPQAIEKIQSNWEGNILCVSFDELEVFLQRPDWVDSGKGQILAWLALGTPGCKSTPTFNGKTSEKLFKTIIDKM